MYLKSSFIQKYPLLIWLCIHFLQSQPQERGPGQGGRGLDRGQGGGQDIPVGGLCQRPLATSPPPLSKRGRWSVVLYIFLFFPNSYFYIMAEF